MRDILVHPSNPTWRVRLHPTSRLFTAACYTHGPGCPHSSVLELHHVQWSWADDERDAHPGWMHDLVDMCSSSSADDAINSHRCDDLCALFQSNKPATADISSKTEPTVYDEIAYFHGSKLWDAYWDTPPTFSLDPSLAQWLTPAQIELATKHLRNIGQYYADMEKAGFFLQTAAFMKAVFATADPERPRYPSSGFGPGFSGFDRIDERGWDRAGYEHTEGHSPDDWGLRSSYQIAYFVALGRIFQIPAGHLVAYDPCYSIVDVVLLASLGVRALRKQEPALRVLRRFTNPTLMYAPGAEQAVFTRAIQRADPIENLVILGGDAAWCDDGVAHFTASYRCVRVPGYVTVGSSEAPCGEENCLQWIPRSKVVAFNTARGPASEPRARYMQMPDGSLEPDD